MASRVKCETAPPNGRAVRLRYALNRASDTLGIQGFITNAEPLYPINALITP